MRPTFTPSARSLAETDIAVVAFAVRGDGDDGVEAIGVDGLDTRIGRDVAEVLTGAAATGKAGEIIAIPAPDLVAFGVGVGAATPDDLRTAGAALARRVRGMEAVATAVHTAAADADAGVDAFVTGMVLGSFSYSLRTDAAAETAPRPPVRRVVLLGGGVDQEVVARAEAVAAASWLARELATIPANLKNPEILADQAARLADEVGLKARVWDEAALVKDGFGGILAVGAGSVSPPRLVQLDYAPVKARRRTAHVVLVGKGITFDTGGLSLKPADAMTTMKRDMTGAAVVLATMTALAAVGVPVRVTGLLALAENAIDGGAMRPGDVITHWGGRTSEVTNTDAEGRLVLADALAYAAERLRPDVIVDVATLTGAMKVALGLRTGGYFATDEALGAALESAAEASGERVWRMPLVEEYRSLLDSKVADADNAADQAGAITAALFLQPFTAEIAWAHLDIASVGDAAKDDGVWTPGPTGFGARLLLEWLGSPDPTAGIG